MFNKGLKLASVNKKTKNMARPEAMAEFVLVLNRMIHTMAKYCHHSLPIKFEELDVKDGFWRMAVLDEDAWSFCYVLASLQTTIAIDEI